jgi:hypothetical protein
MTGTQTKPRSQGTFQWTDAKTMHIQARFKGVWWPLMMTGSSAPASRHFARTSKRSGLPRRPGSTPRMRLRKVALASGEEPSDNPAWELP